MRKTVDAPRVAVSFTANELMVLQEALWKYEPSEHMDLIHKLKGVTGKLLSKN